VLQEADFTAVRLPVTCNAANLNPSIGNDPYDYFDLGEYDQRGPLEKMDEVTAFIAYASRLLVYADIVTICNNAADARELSLLTDRQGWTVFNPLSGKLPQTWQCQRGRL